MGCWDIFCVLCGNTCHKMFDNDTDDDSREAVEYHEIKKKIGSKLNWLNHCTVLAMDDSVIHGCIETNCNVTFQKGNKIYEALGKHSTGSFNDIITSGYTNVGIFVHDDCWKYTKDKIGIELKYSDFPVDRTKIYSYEKLFNVSYGKIEAYWAQDFIFDMAFKKGHIALCESPLKSSACSSTIKKVMSSLKIKKKDGRVSPSTSATFYKNGTIKVGIDKNFWKVSHGKWAKVMGETILSKVEINMKDKNAIKKLKTLTQIGDICNGTVVVKSFETNHKKHTIKMQLLHIAK